jgi:hypothetical protein
VFATTCDEEKRATRGELSPADIYGRSMVVGIGTVLLIQLEQVDGRGTDERKTRGTEAYHTPSVSVVTQFKDARGEQHIQTSTVHFTHEEICEMVRMGEWVVLGEEEMDNEVDYTLVPAVNDFKTDAQSQVREQMFI